MAAVQSLGTISISTYPNGVTGEVYNDSGEITVTNTLVLGGVNTLEFDGTGIPAITLTTGPGQSFRDNPGALTYNPANGVAINFNIVPDVYNNGIVVPSDGISSNVTISNLQFKLTNGNNILSTDTNSTNGQIIVENCILYDVVGGFGAVTGTVTIYRNNLIFALGGQIDGEFIPCPHGCVFDGPAGPGAHLYYCTIVAPSDLGTSLADNGLTSTAGESGPNAETTVVNCAVFGFRVISDQKGVPPGMGFGMAYTTCMTDSPASAPLINCGVSGTVHSGSEVTTGLTYANQFNGVTSSSPDFRVKSGADLIGAGTPVSGITTDIFGNLRDANTPTIGCYEFPKITSVLIAGSASAASFDENTGKATVGLITAPTSDGSFPSSTITGKADGFHPTSGTAGSITLLAPSGGARNAAGRMGESR